MQYNSGSVSATLNKSPFQDVTVYLNNFRKGSHIFYVFDLNSKVCCYIVGAHLSIDQVTYFFMMDAA